METDFSNLFYIAGAPIAVGLIALVLYLFPRSYLEKLTTSTKISNHPTFTRIVIDPTPPVTTLEKALADLDGDGRQDAIIGFGNPPGSTVGQGIAWYEYPHSGVVTDLWKKHIIVAAGRAYEDLLPFDVNNDGAIDVVASIDENVTQPSIVAPDICWFENPKGRGGNPTADRWLRHTIGSGAGENMMRITDLDGDGLPDVITGSYVYFQDSPTKWASVKIGNARRGIALLDIGSGNGPINAVTTDSSTFETIWLENPRENGGDARTGRWIRHVIGLGYLDCTLANCAGGVAAYATGDLNGDGKMDVVSVQAEGDFSPATGGMLWWEMPPDPRYGGWIKHTIDPGFISAHNVRLADIDGDGRLDIVSAEQEQSSERRVAVFYGDGAGSFSVPQVLSTGSGHNVWVSDVDVDGDLDILSAPHGYFGHPNPVELYVNQYASRTSADAGRGRPLR